MIALLLFVFVGAHVTQEDNSSVNAITCARSHAVRNKLITAFQAEVDKIEGGIADAYATLAVTRFIRMGAERDKLKAEHAEGTVPACT